MRNTARWATAGTLLTAAVLGPLSGTALATPATSDSLYAPTALTLTVAKGETAASSVPLRAVTLNCQPTGGSHPAAAKACADLFKADGDFNALPVNEDRMCPMIYDPYVVTAEGVFDGRRVSYERTFGNSCVLGAEQSHVFAF
ncbi:subtilase-type protease inhibitor [Streptomyces durbertensis]|uniref:Subtilase-type protease inhibitor n=1 Tax=Streptomyces durbertensis TaxID=2448886 RepID=A0ABR6ED55_9ACTN|nr:subtilase-type protease inhibitor [Streptomyces durbertensis]MBB1243173.1 subtilase-type protease inhibitor [Streptomyces durbertensis]